MNALFSLSIKVLVSFVGLFVLLVAIFILPLFAQEAAFQNPEYAYLKYPILIGIYVTLIPFMYAIYQTVQLIDRKEKHPELTERTLQGFRKITSSATIIGLLYLIGMIFLFIQNALHPGIALAGFFIIAVCASISAFLTILRKLLERNIHLKHENELTI